MLKGSCQRLLFVKTRVMKDITETKDVVLADSVKLRKKLIDLKRWS